MLCQGWELLRCPSSQGVPLGRACQRPPLLNPLAMKKLQVAVQALGGGSSCPWGLRPGDPTSEGLPHLQASKHSLLWGQAPHLGFMQEMEKGRAGKKGMRRERSRQETEEDAIRVP